MTSAESQDPLFDFDAPAEYGELRHRNLIAYKGSSGLDPWFYLDASHVFDARKTWPHGPCHQGRLIAFARRYDSDEVACFWVSDSGRVDQVVVIKGWSGGGYELIASYPSFRGWLHSAVDDAMNGDKPV